MPIPQTIIASPGASYNSGELHCCDSAQQPSRMHCIEEDAELSRHRFAFSFDSEHPALQKSSKSGSTNRRQAVSHRRFATPIPRASHTHVPVKLKYYRGAGSVQAHSCSDKKEGLKIDTSATQNMFEQSSQSNSDENFQCSSRCKRNGLIKVMGGSICASGSTDRVTDLVKHFHVRFALRQARRMISCWWSLSLNGHLWNLMNRTDEILKH